MSLLFSFWVLRFEFFKGWGVGLGFLWDIGG